MNPITVSPFGVRTVTRTALFPLFVAGLLTSFPELRAQQLDSATRRELENLEALPVTSFLLYLDNVRPQQRQTYLNNEYLRHQVIRRLDFAIDTLFDFWIDRRSFEAFLSSAVAPAGQEAVTRDADGAMAVQQDPRFAPFLEDSAGAMVVVHPNRSKWKWAKDSLLRDSDLNLLFRYLQLDTNLHDAGTVCANLGELRHHSTLQYLSWAYYRHISRYPLVAGFIKDRNYELIQQQMAVVEAQEFVHYKSNNVNTQAVKEIDFYMDNDFFQPLQSLNHDRNYTGGGGLTFATDYFAMRWLNLAWLFRKPEKMRRVVLTYQSIGLNMHFYTPFIRYRNNFDLADTLYREDRPFASYVYVDRSKYRLWPKGLMRHHSSFQVGQIGSELGSNVQALLHRDATVQSQKVRGWENQIADGGRWLVQMNHRVDFLAFSTSNRYQSIFCPDAKNKSSSYSGANLILNTELMLGGYMSAVGGGVTFSTLDFTKQSGQKTVKARWNNATEFGWNFFARLSYRYVIHNSTLEGFGYFLTYRDDAFDDENTSVYTLNQQYYQQYDRDHLDSERSSYPRVPSSMDQVERNLFMFDLGFQLRWRKMTVYGNWRLHTKEFEDTTVDYLDPYFVGLIADNVEQEYYKQKTVPELNDYRDLNFYGYGTMGVSFLLEK